MKDRFDLFKNKGFLGERLFELGVYLKTEKIKTIISVSQVHFSQKPQSFFQNSLQIWPQKTFFPFVQISVQLSLSPYKDLGTYSDLGAYQKYFL